MARNETQKPPSKEIIKFFKSVGLPHDSARQILDEIKVAIWMSRLTSFKTEPATRATTKRLTTMSDLATALDAALQKLPKEVKDALWCEMVDKLPLKRGLRDFMSNASSWDFSLAKTYERVCSFADTGGVGYGFEKSVELFSTDILRVMRDSLTTLCESAEKRVRQGKPVQRGKNELQKQLIAVFDRRRKKRPRENSTIVITQCCNFVNVIKTRQGLPSCSPWLKGIAQTTLLARERDRSDFGKFCRKEMRKLNPQWMPFK